MQITCYIIQILCIMRNSALICMKTKLQKLFRDGRYFTTERENE